MLGTPPLSKSPTALRKKAGLWNHCVTLSRAAPIDHVSEALSSSTTPIMMAADTQEQLRRSTTQSKETWPPSASTIAPALLGIVAMTDLMYLAGRLMATRRKRFL